MAAERAGIAGVHRSGRRHPARQHWQSRLICEVRSRQDFARSSVDLNLSYLFRARLDQVNEDDRVIFRTGQLAAFDFRSREFLEDQVLGFVLGDLTRVKPFVLARVG